LERLYSLVLYLLLPLALLRLFWRSLHLPAYRSGWRERVGLDAEGPKPAGVWVHAVSVGEVQAALPLLKALMEGHPNLGVLVTTTTPTGAVRLRELLGERVAHRYMPYDLGPILRRLLDRLAPRLVVVMETEIWPNLIAVCERRGIPLVLANARLSARSAAGYARFGAFTARTLRRISLIAAQSEADASRFIALGAKPERVRVTGSVKFDVTPPASLRDRSEAIRRLWGSTRLVWVAGSTHEGEEEAVLEAHERIRREIPDALLVLVPRHPERFPRVAALVRRHRFSLVARTEDRSCAADTAVFLGDTMGELAVFLGAADAAFIGGSLVGVGGHNLLEAAAAGLPVAVGPHTFNFAEITELLVERGAAVRVAGPEALAEVMGGWLADAVERSRIGECGRRVVKENRGALKRLLDLLEERLAAGR
jgi:3-deoxy-D-manno-octulosonic-acid transferase